MLIEGQFPVAAPPRSLLQHLFDARLMASCLPGCETIEPLADERYRAVVVIAMAGVKARFDLRVEVTRKDDSNVWATTRGEEGGNASTLQAESQVTLQPDGSGTLVIYRSEVSVTGRLGRFALGMMKKKAQSLGDEFAQNLQSRLEELGANAAADVVAGESAGAVASESAGAVASASADAVASGGAYVVGSAATAAVPAPRRSWWQALLAWWRGERKPDAVRPGH